MSATRHSSRISIGLTASLAFSLASFGTGSGGLAVATCMGGVSGGIICDELGNAASTIDSGSSEAAVVSMAVPVTDSAAVATSALATAALPIVVGCDASASSASAVTDGARRSWIGTAPACSMPAEPKPASQATTQAARTTVPHNAAATVANRRGFMIALPPKAPTALIFRIKISTRNEGNCRSSIFPKSVARMQRAAGNLLYILPRKGAGEVSDPPSPTLSYDASG